MLRFYQFLLLWCAMASLAACGGTDSAAPAADTPATITPTTPVVGTAGGRAQSTGSEFRLDFGAGQLAGDTAFDIGALPTSPADLVAALPPALAGDYEAVPDGAWRAVVSGMGWSPNQSIAASIAAAPRKASGLTADAVGRSRALAVPDPSTPPTTRRALVQCPDSSVRLVTSEYSDGREVFLINCPALQSGAAQPTLTVVLVNLTSTAPVLAEWTRQVGGGANQYAAASVDSSGRMSVVVLPQGTALGGPVTAAAPLRFVSYDSAGRIRSNTALPIPQVVGTPTPHFFNVAGLHSLGSGSHLLYGRFAATAAESDRLWVMTVDETLAGPSPASAVQGLTERWSKAFGYGGASGAHIAVRSTAWAVATNGEISFAGVIGEAGQVDPTLGVRGPFVAHLSAEGVVRWVAPVAVQTSSGAKPTTVEHLAVDSKGNLVALGHLGMFGFGTKRDANHCANADDCLLLLKFSGIDGSLLWTTDVESSLSPGFALAVDATDRPLVVGFTRNLGPLREGLVNRYSPAGSIDYGVTLAGTVSITKPLAFGASPTGSAGVVYEGILNFKSNDPLLPEQSGVFFQTLDASGKPTAPRLLSGSEMDPMLQSGLFDVAGNAYAVFASKVNDVPGGGTLNVGCTNIGQCFDLFVSKVR